MPVFFFKSGNPLSNFYRVHPYKVMIAPYGEFMVTSSEQHFMLLKAAHYDDRDAIHKLRKNISPKEAKAIGRSVIGYSDEVWHKAQKVNSEYTLAEEYMFQALLAKYDNCYEFKLAIQQYAGEEIVEASPHDKIWGIGFDEEKASKVTRDKWGKNWLGKTHMRLAALKCGASN